MTGRWIVSGDWHARGDRPRCRLDESWLQAQLDAFREVVKLANSREARLLITGDVFDTANVPSIVLVSVIDALNRAKRGAYFIAGNHDLPYHNIANVNRSSIGVLMSIATHSPRIACGVLDANWAHFGGDVHGDDDASAVVRHVLTFEKEKDIPPNVNALSASDLLHDYPGAKWILTGDMHRAFHFERKGRHVINPGCVTVQTADMLDYEPSVFFVDFDDETVERIPLTTPANVVTDAYLREAEERDERIDAFVERVKTSGDVSLDFVANVEAALKTTKASKATTAMVRELMEGDE